MRSLILMSFFVLASVEAAEVSKLVCKGRDGYTFESTLRDLNVDGMYNGECEEHFYGGSELCYKGKPSEVVQILKGLSDGDLLGDEYRLRNIRVSGSKITYTVWDGPNETSAATGAIGRCK